MREERAGDGRCWVASYSHEDCVIVIIIIISVPVAKLLNRVKVKYNDNLCDVLRSS